MEHERAPHDQRVDVPSTFADYIIREIPAEVWARTFEEQPTLKASLLEGFSHRAHKPARLFRKPQFQAHMRRYLLSHPEAMDEVLKVWGQENLFLVAFLEMLDRGFVLDNFKNLKNLLGPEPFFAGLTLLGCFHDEDFRAQVREDFWMRHVSADAVEPLTPMLDVWIGFARQFPHARHWLKSLLPSVPMDASVVPASDEEPREAPPSSAHASRLSPHEGERHRKLETKIERLNEEKEHLEEQVARLRKDNEELRKKVAAWETSFETRMEEAVALHRLNRFERYGSVDEAALEEAEHDLAALIRRAERAFELQREADEKYGLVSAVRQQMLRVDLYLKEIEKIYAESLVVHSEVSRVKEALLFEKKRLLGLPGIHKVLKSDPALMSPEDLRQKIRFLEAEPENLSRLDQIHHSLLRLAAARLIEDAQPLLDDIQQKRRQILETLYARFQPSGRSGGGGDERATSLDDLVDSGNSGLYDVYVDGYNILLKAHGNRMKAHPASLAALRDDFINAVCRKARLFRKVHLVFDGVESHRDIMGNAVIIYTDKKRGETADSVIIHALERRKDNRALLVTADQEIIRRTEHRVYATVDPYHFYLFVFETDHATLGAPVD